MKRLFLLAMLVACNASAADFGDIPASLALPAGTSVRRNAGNTGFESFTPGGGGGTPGGSDMDIQFNNSGSFGGSDDFRWINDDVALLIGGSSFSIADQGNIRVPKTFTIQARNNADDDNFVILNKKVTSGHDDLVIGDSAGGHGAITFNGAGNNMTIVPATNGSVSITASNGTIAFSTSTILGYDTDVTGDLEIQSGGWLAIFPQTRANLIANHLASPFEGVIYTDSTDHHFYGYNGTAFIQLDNNPTPTPTATFTPTPTATSTATPTATSTATPTPTPTATATPDVSDVPYDATSWDGVTTFAPSKNAVRDIIETILASIALKAPLASPTFTGVPLAPTASQGTSNTQIATTAYTDTAVSNAIAGVNPAVAVQAATTAAGDTSSFVYSNGVSGIGATLTGPTANVAVTIDGYTFTAVGQRLLVKNDTQSPSGAFNGVYYVTTIQAPAIKPVLTRALDYDMPSDINNTGAIPVVNGTVNGITSWVLTSQVTTVGTDPLTFTKFSINPTTIALTSNPLSQFAATTSLQLAGVISDETGSGSLVFANTPTLVTPALGAATATSINGNTFTTGTYTLTGVAGKTLTFNKSITLDGTDSTTMTFPSTSATIARTDAANTFTGHQTIEGVTSTGATGTGKFVFDTSPTLVTPLLGTPTSGDGRNMSAATDSVTGEMSAADHTTLTNLSVVQPSGSPPPFIAAGLPVMAYKTGVDLKNAATVTIFTVPTSRSFLLTGIYIQVTTVTNGGAGAFNFQIKESSAARTMSINSLGVSGTPVVNQTTIAMIPDSTAPTQRSNCTAGNSVQIVVATSNAGSTAVSGTVYVSGIYTQSLAGMIVALLSMGLAGNFISDIKRLRKK